MGAKKKHDFLTLKSPFFQIQQNFRILENLSSIQNLPFICSRFYEEAYKKRAYDQAHLWLFSIKEGHLVILQQQGGISGF